MFLDVGFTVWFSPPLLRWARLITMLTSLLSFSGTWQAFQNTSHAAGSQPAYLSEKNRPESPCPTLTSWDDNPLARNISNNCLENRCLKSCWKQRFQLGAIFRKCQWILNFYTPCKVGVHWYTWSQLNKKKKTIPNIAGNHQNVYAKQENIKQNFHLRVKLG